MTDARYLASCLRSLAFALYREAQVLEREENGAGVAFFYRLHAADALCEAYRLRGRHVPFRTHERKA